jgi:hypothetical protein
MQTAVIVPLRSPAEQHEAEPAVNAEPPSKRSISSLSFVKDEPDRCGAGRHFWKSDRLGQSYAEANNRGQDMAIECVEYAIGANMPPVIGWAIMHMAPYGQVDDQEERGLQIGFIAGLAELAMIGACALNMDAYREQMAGRREKLATLITHLRGEEDRRNVRNARRRARRVAAKGGEAASTPR